MSFRKARKVLPRRSGLAVLEMALVLFTLMVMSMGMVEYGQFLYVRHAFQAAARDGTRQATVPGSALSNVTTAITNDLAQANVAYNASWITYYDINATSGAVTTVADPTTIATGDGVRTVITTTYASIPNALRPLSAICSKAGIGSSKVITGFCTMIAE